MHTLGRRAVEDHNEIPQVPRASQSQCDASSSDPPNFALSHYSLSSSETPSDPISFSANCIKPPILRHKAFLLGPDGPDDLRSLEPDHLGFSPALLGLTHRSEGQFQSIFPALLPPLEDADIRPPDQLGDLITPTPKILHNRTGYFGQDALEKLKQNRPVRGGRESTVPTPHLTQSGARRMAQRHDVAAQDTAVVERSGNVQAVGGPACVVSPTPRYPNLLRFPIRPSFTTRNYAEVFHERLSALQLQLPPQTLDPHLGPSPRFGTPKLAASDPPSPSNSSELPTPSTRYHTPASLPSPFLQTSNSPSNLSVRPSPAHSPAPSAISLSSAPRSASRCSSNLSSKSPLRIESHPRLGAAPVVPRVKRDTPPPVPGIPDKYRRERSVERWLRLPGIGGEAEGRRGSGGSLGTLRQAKSMENLSHIGYEMEDEATEKVETVNEKHANRSLSDSIVNNSCEPPHQESEEAGERTSPNGSALNDGITTLPPSFPRSRSPSILVHGPVLQVDETFEEGMNWLHIKSVQSRSGEIQIENTPNWFERSRTPSPIGVASPYLTVFHSPAHDAASGPRALVKKLSGSFVKVSRGLRHVTSSSGLGIMIGQEGDPSRSSSSTKSSKLCLNGRVTPHEAASLSSSNDSVRFSGRKDDWRDPSGGRYRGSNWSARDPVVRSLESELSVGERDQESVRLVDFLNEEMPCLLSEFYHTEAISHHIRVALPRGRFLRLIFPSEHGSIARRRLVVEKPVRKGNWR